MYLHILRYQEFTDQSDALAIYVTLGKLNQGKQEKPLQQFLEEIIIAFRDNNLDFEKIKKQQLLVASYGGRKAALNRLNKDIVNFISKDLTWQNSNFQIPPFSINIANHTNQIISINDQSLLEDNFILRDYIYFNEIFA